MMSRFTSFLITILFLAGLVAIPVNFSGATSVFADGHDGGGGGDPAGGEPPPDDGGGAPPPDDSGGHECCERAW